MLDHLDRCCLHTMTTKPWSLAEAAANYAAKEIPWITVWRQHLPENNATAARTILDDHGLQVASLCRGGFFSHHKSADRQKSIDDNLLAIDEAATIGAPLVVLVCGAVPGMPLAEARAQITDGIAAVLPHAQACGVKLAIEPLHPCYAADRSAVNTMAQARQICEQLLGGKQATATCDSAPVGIAVDVYHVWWDDQLAEEIARAGRQGLLHAYHICDWKAEQADMLTDRGLMGEGCIDIGGISRLVDQAGFTGPIEVEIFSERYWRLDQSIWLQEVLQAYRNVLFNIK
jgi:sugar phosphate isomerase/epimerase